MKIVHFCMQDFGGAGGAALRISRALRAAGHRSTLMVTTSKSGDPHVRLIPPPAGSPYARPGMVRSPSIDAHERRWQGFLARYPGRPEGLEIFTDGQSDTRLDRLAEVREADIVHFHWVSGVVDLTGADPALTRRPTVWTLHDMNPFTGGCHYAGGCDRWRDSCGRCPQLGSNDVEDASRAIHAAKERCYGGLRLGVATPSRWLGECAGASSLLGRFPRMVIPNSLPLDVFSPSPDEVRLEVRKALDIPADSLVLLFGAEDVANRRKGFHFLLKALRELRGLPGLGNVTAAVFGNLRPELAERFPCRLAALGYVDDEEQLALLYSMADGLLLPSMEDNLPNTVLEAMACGLPVVAFDVGGLPDMVEHRSTGWLAPAGDVAGLVAGVRWLAAMRGRDAVRERCRARSSAMASAETVAAGYLRFYESMLAGAGEGASR